MLRTAIALAAALVIATVSTSAFADPPRHAGGEKSEKYRGGHGKSEKHYSKHGLRGLHLERYSNGPPPWAPAHGYRRKAGWYDNQGYRDYGLKAPPVDLSVGRCNRDVIGQVLGGGLGAVIGSKVGGGDGRLVAVAAGTIIGVLVGGEVGRSMDRTDALCVDQVLESAPDGQTIVWNSDRENFRVTPTQTARVEDGRY